ncbi:hypothetical protein GOP47_0024677 [Adiantum capillus-veneris]|uniref:Uncharacterized protein n=1 Tax=Adiantum capillus-veneris TaxID=13818 RepID=A0A9D4U2P9_ADICA|nr:hypothetical protein GOP47_0024677 [Adiantum capillus-veneris]
MRETRNSQFLEQLPDSSFSSSGPGFFPSQKQSLTAFSRWSLQQQKLSIICEVFLWSKHSTLRLSLPENLFRFALFITSQIVFLLGEVLVTHPEDKDVASATDIIFGFLKLVWRAIVGASLDKDSALDNALLVQKLQTSRDRALFVFSCAIAGSLSIMSLTWNSSSHLSAKEEACRGAALGLLYAFWHLYTKRMILRFPIIQRSPFFTLKLGLKEMIRKSLKLAVFSVPFAEVSILILNTSTFAVKRKNSENSFVVRELDLVVLAALTALLWETAHHLVEALHTRRFRFAPPLGTSAAETNPSEIFLVALEETEKSSLTHYLATLDLCMLSEHNSDKWRLQALFEETGETYSQVISICSKPLNMLTVKLAKGLDGLSEAHEKDILKHQMKAAGQDVVPPAYQILRDYQLCSWCARILSSLTASSKYIDRYGVAQLRGCNGAVVSSLISCLLVIEVYLGRRSSTHPGQMIGVQSIKWTIPSRGPVVDPGKKQGFPFLKKSELYKKAYAMADVLRTSLYQIVTTFRKEMVVSGPGGMAIAERDWLDKGQPLYGTCELHVQILRLLLDFRL